MLDGIAGFSYERLCQNDFLYRKGCEAFAGLYVEYDDKMSDKKRRGKVVHMRNILTEKRQWCKVITGKKTGMTHEI